MPACSPDGSRIAFVSNRQGSFGLYIAPTEGVSRMRSSRSGIVLAGGGRSHVTTWPGSDQTMAARRAK